MNSGFAVLGRPSWSASWPTHRLNWADTWVDSGRRFAPLGPTTCPSFAQSWPASAIFGWTRPANVGQIWANLDEVWPNFHRARPNLAGIDRIGGGALLARFGFEQLWAHNFPAMGRIWAELGQIGAESEQMSAKLGRLVSKLAEIAGKRSEIGQKLAVLGPSLARSLSSLGRLGPNLGPCWPSSPGSAQIWSEFEPGVAQLGPLVTEVGLNLTEFGKFSAAPMSAKRTLPPRRKIPARVDAGLPTEAVWSNVRKLFAPTVVFVLGSPGAGKAGSAVWPGFGEFLRCTEKRGRSKVQNGYPQLI